MNDVVAGFFSCCSGPGALLEPGVGRAEPIKGEKCRTKVSEGRNSYQSQPSQCPDYLRGPRVYILLGSSSKTLDSPMTLTDTQTLVWCPMPPLEMSRAM